MLAASSEYFKVMFMGKFKETEQDTIILQDIKAIAFKEVLNFVYEGEINVRSNTVRDVYDAANMLQYDVMKDLCMEYINRDIRLQTCIDYLRFAERMGLENLREKSEDCLSKYLEPENFEKSIELAEEYSLDSLLIMIEQKMIQDLKPTNSVEYFEVATRHSFEKLKEKVKSCMYDNVDCGNCADFYLVMFVSSKI